MTNEYGVFLGLDVGKSDHHAVAFNPAGKRLHDAALPNTEPGLRKLFDKLGRHGRILAVVDQPASIGALPVAVARSCGHQIAYLPGLVMRRLADLHPGTAKTDARDAFVIADAARTLPHTLRRVDAGDDTLAELEVLVGYDDDLAGEVTRVSNRIRGLLTQIHPPLERVLGPKVQHHAILEVLSRCGGPAGLRKAGRSKLAEIVMPRAPRMGARLVEQIFTALDAQTVVVPGTTAAETILPRLADSVRELLKQRDQIAFQVEEILDAHPLAEVLISMPGVGIRTAARILLEVGDVTSFPTSAHLAAYAGLAPVTRRSGTSIRGEHPPKGGNKQLKRAIFLSAFAALSDPLSRAYYDRKRRGQKTQRRAHLPRPPPGRRPPRHAPHPQPVPAQTSRKARPRRLTKPIGTPRVVPTDQLVVHAAVSAFLGRYRGQTRVHTESDLCVLLRWCTNQDLGPLAAARVDIERYVRWLQDVRRYQPSTVSRRLSVVVGFYRVCVIDAILEHSPADYVRRPTVPAESPTLGLGHLQFEALITTARKSPNPNGFALVALLGLLGLRIFEACGSNIADLGEEHGHRVLRVRGKGGKVVLVPLPPAVARAIDQAVDERTSGPILRNHHGRRMDRHVATRRLKHLVTAAGIRMPRMHPHMLRHTFVTTMLGAGVSLRDVQIAARHADPRTTMRYDRARKNLDRHPNYILAAYMASGT